MTEPWYDKETQQHYKLAPHENGIGLFSCNADGSAGYHHRQIFGEDNTRALDNRWSAEQILARRLVAIEERSALVAPAAIGHDILDDRSVAEQQSVIDLMAALKESLAWKPEGNIG